MFGNRYFEFDEPIHWFRKIGSSASNTYVGRSRAYDTVHRLTAIEPGDQVHALVGGTFVVRADGAVEEGRFRLPKHIFEKSYGPRDSDADFLARVASAGRCREIEAGKAMKADYGALRKAGYPDLPDHMGHLAREEGVVSPLLRKLLDAAVAEGLEEAAATAGGKLVALEVGHAPESTECAMRIEVPGSQAIEVVASPDRREVWVRDRSKEFAPSLREAASAGLTPEYRNEVVTIFPESEMEGVMRAVGDFAWHGQVYAPDAHAPR